MASIQRVEWARLRRPGPADANSMHNHRFAVRVVADGKIKAGTELAVWVRAQSGRTTPATVRVERGRRLGYHHICRVVDDE